MSDTEEEKKHKNQLYAQCCVRYGFKVCLSSQCEAELVITVNIEN